MPESLYMHIIDVDALKNRLRLQLGALEEVRSILWLVFISLMPVSFYVCIYMYIYTFSGITICSIDSDTMQESTAAQLGALEEVRKLRLVLTSVISGLRVNPLGLTRGSRLSRWRCLTVALCKIRNGSRRSATKYVEPSTAAW